MQSRARGLAVVPGTRLFSGREFVCVCVYTQIYIRAADERRSPARASLEREREEDNENRAREGRKRAGRKGSVVSHSRAVRGRKQRGHGISIRISCVMDRVRA